MAIFTGPLWPNGAVPFLLVGDDANRVDMLGWIDNLNLRLGVRLFIPYLPIYGYSGYAPPAGAPAAVTHVRITKNAVGGSGIVGYGQRITAVAADTESKMVHELLHVLGFQHEQYHPRFGWIAAAAANKTNENPDQMVTQSCASDGAWNTLLVNHCEAVGLLFANQDWKSHQLANFQPDDGTAYDLNSAMMYPSARRAAQRMKRLIMAQGADASWLQKMTASQVLTFNESPLVPPPTVGPYALSMRDKQAITSRYRGSATIAAQMVNRWTHATSRNILHHRSPALRAVDAAVESCDIRRLRPAFNAWYSNNEAERTHRNQGGLIEALRAALEGDWGFVPVP